MCCEGYEPSALNDKVCQPILDPTILDTHLQQQNALVSSGSPKKAIGLFMFCTFYIIFGILYN